MGSRDNFHDAIVQRVQSGELLLGVSRSRWLSARTRRRALSGASEFERLWDEGALSLKLAITPPSLVGAETCMSPDGDYRQFMAQYFLRAREYGNQPARARVFS
jgi:hypothetical protein